MKKDRKKYIPYGIYLDSDGEEELFNLLEDARKAKGMTRKGFILYAAANMVPEIAPRVMDFLLSKPASKNTKAIIKDVDKVLKDAE